MTTLHVGRTWTGHAIEDACPCPQEPCGLVDISHAHPDAGGHGAEASRG